MRPPPDLALPAAGKETRLPAGLLASAQLGLPAAAAALGLASGALGPAVAAALVAGGVLTPPPALALSCWPANQLTQLLPLRYPPNEGAVVHFWRAAQSQRSPT